MNNAANNMANMANNMANNLNNMANNLIPNANFGEIGIPNKKIKKCDEQWNW